MPDDLDALAKRIVDQFDKWSYANPQYYPTSAIMWVRARLGEAVAAHGLGLVGRWQASEARAAREEAKAVKMRQALDAFNDGYTDSEMGLVCMICGKSCLPPQECDTFRCRLLRAALADDAG